MKKIAVNTVKAFLKQNKEADSVVKSFQVGDSAFDVQFHTHLTTDEKSTFIRRVISGCFDRTGAFRPEYVSPVTRATILQMCTNVPVISMKGEQGDDGGSVLDLDAMNDLYMAMDLDHMEDGGYQNMMQEMVYLCSAAIDWKKSQMLQNTNKAADEVLNSIRNVIEKVSDKVADMDTESLVQYAGELSRAAHGLDDGGILKGLLLMQNKDK